MITPTTHTPTRLSACFEALRAAHRKALIPYLSAGFPHQEWTVPLMHTLVAAGADILELGIPFSDPMADGPVIQKAGERALQGGMNTAGVLACVSQFRKKNAHTPIVLMGYANPMESYEAEHGQGRFVRDAAKAGADGLLIVDYPPMACSALSTQLAENKMDLIFLLAPTSTTERMEEVGHLATGYVYYVALKGVTGASTLDVNQVTERLPLIRQHVSVPIGVGFGISDAQSAQAVAQVADAIIIGSKVVSLIDQATLAQSQATVTDFIRVVRTALDT
jgi:tryptophan synthase alpha chain